ncbi:MAG TPA: hypothetical protein VMH33_04175 [Solirubrobacterales bacterium]|nr:hypothetical protein [Solirubrobacterales bacterium]
MKRLRPKLTFANAVSVLALFVALGGGAYAATQLPKNSVGSKQIKKAAVTPAKLSTAAKATLTGSAGPQGKEGPKGDKGEKGEPGPFPSALPSGKTIVGAFDAEGTATAAGQLVTGDISYLYSAPEQTVVYVSAGGSDPNCTGTWQNPTAPIGYTCVYGYSEGDLASHGINFETSSGVGLYAFSAAAGHSKMVGTWAATGK